MCLNCFMIVCIVILLFIVCVWFTVVLVSLICFFYCFVLFWLYYWNEIGVWILCSMDWLLCCLSMYLLRGCFAGFVSCCIDVCFYTLGFLFCPRTGMFWGSLCTWIPSAVKLLGLLIGLCSCSCGLPKSFVAVHRLLRVYYSCWFVAFAVWFAWAWLLVYCLRFCDSFGLPICGLICRFCWNFVVIILFAYFVWYLLFVICFVGMYFICVVAMVGVFDSVLVLTTVVFFYVV